MHQRTKFAGVMLLITILNAPAYAGTFTRDFEPPLTRIIKFIKHLFHPSANDDTFSVPKP